MSTTHTYTISLFTQGLHSLKHTLQKAESHAKATNVPVDSYATETLIADMKPLSFQVFITANTAIKAAYRCTSREPPSQEDTDKTFEDFYKRIDETIAELESITPETVQEHEGKSFKAPLGPKEFEFTGESYAVVFAVPNFFFHLVTVYDILRARGVPLGKIDYLGEFLKPIGGF
ncbi:DUF1993 domain-containing protein [Aspergillus stella-maris]|uniref:DUF1993 domain-containing protein n=1 Tax=Aspergillus stella-maris TaxID=1810926 RepID=UPI003CCDB4E5